MRCPLCKDPENRSRVLDSREAGAGSVIRRRRECLTCKRRYTTYERTVFRGSHGDEALLDRWEITGADTTFYALRGSGDSWSGQRPLAVDLTKVRSVSVAPDGQVIL